MIELHPEYLPNLERALEFELFVQDCLLHEKHLHIGIYRHKYFQFQHGESHSGLEVKLDNRFGETGHLFIETAERPSVKSDWKPSGIYHKHAPWLFVVGSEKMFWLLFTKHLCAYAERPEYRTITPSHQTSKGYLLPIEKANTVAGYIWQQ